MSVRAEFRNTINAVEQLLEQEHSEPREVRNGIKALVTAYQAKGVVSEAYRNFDDSGVLQWKNYLRAANVKETEPLDAYISRVRSNLDEMRNFESKFLRTKVATPA